MYEIKNKRANLVIINMTFLKYLNRCGIKIRLKKNRVFKFSRRFHKDVIQNDTDGVSFFLGFWPLLELVWLFHGCSLEIVSNDYQICFLF